MGWSRVEWAFSIREIRTSYIALDPLAMLALMTKEYVDFMDIRKIRFENGGFSESNT